MFNSVLALWNKLMSLNPQNKVGLPLYHSVVNKMMMQ